MGAQQMKLYQEGLLEHISRQQGSPLNRISNEMSSQSSNVHIKTVVRDQSACSVSSPKQGITVANFAKIKIETTCAFDDNSKSETLRNTINLEYQKSPYRTEEYIEPRDKSDVCIRDSCGEFDHISLPSVDLKQELLSAPGEGSGKTVAQTDAFVSLSCRANAERSAEVLFPFETEVDEGSPFITNLRNCIVPNPDKNKTNNSLQVSENTDTIAFEITNFGPNSKTFVKNPLAFLKKNCDKNCDQAKCLNIKSEPGVIVEELTNTNSIKVESELQTINLNELVIKSEYLSVSETNEETLQNTDAYQTCLSCNLNASMDVNLSRVGTDLVELASKKSLEDELSNNSLNTTAESLKYFSTYEISSEEDNLIPVQKPHLNKFIKSRKKQTPLQNNINKQLNIANRQNFHKKSTTNRQASKIFGKPKTKKQQLKRQSKKDFAFKSNIKKRDVLKNLPKTAIKTRKSSRKSTAKKGVHSSKAEFPKPFKLETKSTQKDQSALVKLPKPMIKRELTANTRNMQSHLKPEFQPFVRLKRLKSEDLLVPLTTKLAKGIRKFKGTSDTRRDFLIKKAYSLNPRIKCNRLSMDHHDQSLYNQQSVLSSRYATSCSVLTDGQDDSIAGMETRYFSPQETNTFFPSSTPDGSSMFSGPIDSGVSSSTPNTSHHHNFNNALLLEIAAERAFINNHLMHFGHSPIQFDLYNNLHELTIFLKFLLGSLNAN